MAHQGVPRPDAEELVQQAAVGDKEAPRPRRPCCIRGVITVPVELYSEKRIREFDQAEADLDQALRRKKRAR